MSKNIEKTLNQRRNSRSQKKLKPFDTIRPHLSLNLIDIVKRPMLKSTYKPEQEPTSCKKEEMKHISRLSLIGVLFISLLLIGTIPAFAQCDEEDPNCPIDPPQSVEINPDVVEAEGSTANVADPAALEAVESDLSGDRPAIIDPVPLTPRATIAPAFDKLPIPMRWQQSGDDARGVQALGMALEGLGEGSPSSPAILEFLQNMNPDPGSTVEQLALAAQNFGYKGTIPFSNWGLEQLQAELAEGRAPVVALGANGPGQPGHFVTITGFSPDGEWVSYNDPILGEQVVTTEEFTRLWGLRGNTGVAVRKTVPAGERDLVPWVAFATGLMALASQTPWALQRPVSSRRSLAGVSTSRRKIQPFRRPFSSSLGGVPSRAAKAASRRKPRRSRPVASPPPPRDTSAQMFNQALAPRRNTENLGWQAPEPKPEPVLEPVPSFFSSPLGWAQAKIINAGRKNDRTREFLADTLGPMSETLRSYEDPELHPIMAGLRESVPEEGVAVLGVAVATPGFQDDLPVALTLGVIALGTIVFHQFSGKNTPTTKKLVPQFKPIPQNEMLELQFPSGPNNDFEPDENPNKSLKDALGNILASDKISLGSKLIVIFGTLIGAYRTVSGEETKDKNKDVFGPTWTPTPGASPTETPTPTPSSSSTPLPTPSSIPSPTPSPTPTPTSTQIPTQRPTAIPEPRVPNQGNRQTRYRHQPD